MTAVTATGSASPTQNLGLEDFLRVLLTQLTYQDPLKPVDNQQFMANVAQFTTLGQTQEMNQNLQRLLVNQSALQSVGLIGRTVEVVTESGTVTGTVRSLSLTGAAPALSVETGSGSTITADLSQIATVR